VGNKDAHMMGANVLVFNFNKDIEKDNVNVACISSSWLVLKYCNLAYKCRCSRNTGCPEGGKYVSNRTVDSFWKELHHR